MLKHVCNICGIDFDEWDEQEGILLEHSCGYGSKYDGDYYRIDMCCACFDELLDNYILPKCKINPREA